MPEFPPDSLKAVSGKPKAEQPLGEHAIQRALVDENFRATLLETFGAPDLPTLAQWVLAAEEQGLTLTEYLAHKK